MDSHLSAHVSDRGFIGTQKYALPRLCVGTPWSVPLLPSSWQALLTGIYTALDNCSKPTRQKTVLSFVSKAASSVHV